jgi:hypothetical protein
MGDHIVDGEFQSDKYPDCPRGKVPLSVRDVTAQDLLWIYAQRRRAVDAGFSEDLETCLLAAGFGPPQHTVAESDKSERPDTGAVQTLIEELELSPANDLCMGCGAERAGDSCTAGCGWGQTRPTSMQQVVAAAFMAGVEYGEGWIDEAPDADTEAAMYAQGVTADLGPLTPTEGREADPVLSTEERGTLVAIRRLVAVTAKSCSQQQEYIVQMALLDRLLAGDVSAPTL